MNDRIPLKDKTVLTLKERSFRILCSLGCGGSSLVYLAESLPSMEKYVIKEYYPHDVKGLSRKESMMITNELSEKELAVFNAGMKRFGDCTRKKAEISDISPEIRNLLPESCELYRTNGTAYLLMSDSIGYCYSQYREESVGEVIRLFIKLCRAIKEFHRNGLLFIDIKPENVLLTRDATTDDGFGIKLFDFDTVCFTSDLKKQSLALDEKYASPELISLANGGSDPVDCRSDIYSLGVVLYKRLTDKFPGAAEKRGCFSVSPSNIIPGLDADMAVCKLLEKVFEHAMNPSPIPRYNDIDALISNLRAILESISQKGMVLSSSAVSCSTNYIRDARADSEYTLIDLLKTNGKALVYGMTGLGKTEFVRNFISSKLNDPEAVFGTRIYIVSTGNSIRNAVINDSNVEIEGFSRNILKRNTDSVMLSDEEYFRQKLSYIRRDCEKLSRQGKKMVIAFDNADLFSDPEIANENIRDLNELNRAGCWCIVITDSTNISTDHIPQCQIKELSLEYLRKIFTNICDIPEVEYPLLDRIIKRYNYHTLALVLFARGINNSYITLEDINDSIEDGNSGIAPIVPFNLVEVGDNFVNGSFSEIIRRVFSAAFSDDDSILIMQMLSMSSEKGFMYKDLIELTGCSTNKINKLVQCGCITTQKNRFYVHPLIRETITDLYSFGDDCLNRLYQFIINKKKNIGTLTMADIADYIEAGHTLLENGGSSIKTWLLYDAMGKFHGRLGMNADSIRMYQYAISDIEKSGSDTTRGNKARLAVEYMRLSRTYMSGRDIENSQLNLGKSYDYFTELRRTDPGDPQIDLDYVKTLNQLAILCCYTGKVREAVAYCTEGIDIAEAIRDNTEDTKIMDRSYKKLFYLYDTYARILLFLGEYEQARKYYQESLEIKKRYCSRDDLSLTYSYRGLAETSLRLGRPQEAKKYIDCGLRISEKKRGSQTKTADMCILCGEIYEACGMNDKAADFLNQGVSIYQKTLGDRNIFTICAKIEFQLAETRLNDQHENNLEQLFKTSEQSLETLNDIDAFKAVSLAKKLKETGIQLGEDVLWLTNFINQYAFPDIEVRRI